MDLDETGDVCVRLGGVLGNDPTIIWVGSAMSDCSNNPDIELLTFLAIMFEESRKCRILLAHTIKNNDDGVLRVGLGPSSILRRDVVHGPSASSPPVAPLENELLLPDTGLPLIYKRSSLPNKLKERPKSVKAGEYIAVKGTKQHPFYIWKIVKVRKPYLDFQWLEREPNGVYTLLDQVDSEHIFYLVD